MKEKLMKCYLRGQIAAANKLRKFMSEERGASDIVAVIALIVIIIAVATIFSGRLTTAVGDVFDKLTTFIGD